MKKSLFLMAIATVAISSCSSDETLQVNRGNSIEFRAAMGTRATADVFETSNLTQFTVTALNEDNTEKYFENVVFKRDATVTTTYKSDYDYYWPSNDAELNFYAWANVVETPTIDLENKTQYITYVAEKDFSNQKSLLSR